jgi:hypothetical protein
MHHLKETTIDGVKFVLIPEELHDKLVALVSDTANSFYPGGAELEELWEEFDPEIFDGL